MPREQIASFVLFEKTASNAFGNRYRAGEVDGAAIRRHAHLYLLNGSCIDVEGLWELIADRAELAGTLDDPHLGKCLAFDRHGDAPFLAYSFASGRPLNEFLAALNAQKLPISLDQALFIIERASLGLTAAYEVQFRGRPVLHGFLIPDLVYLSGEGEIRVLGTEAAPGLRKQLATHPAFSPYMAPEVRRGDPPAETDDVYSLGAILFHLLCGQPPPAEESPKMTEVVDAARLAAGGDRLPAVIANLLKNSLAPQSNRIPDAVTWQQVVGKIILDGEYNPTTFNLAFLMHTVFRRELDSELAILAQELRQRLTPEPSPEPEILDELPDDVEIPIPPVTEPSSSAAAAGRPFLTGFLVSFLGAAILLTAYFLLFRSPSASAQEEKEKETVAATLASTEAPKQTSAALISPDQQMGEPAPKAGDPLSRTVPEQVFEVDPEEEKIPEIPEEELQRLVEERTEDLEANLRAEYEARLRELEGRLVVANESGAASPIPAGTESEEPTNEEARPASGTGTVASDPADSASATEGSKPATRQTPDVARAADSPPDTVERPGQQGADERAANDGLPDDSSAPIVASLPANDRQSSPEEGDDNATAQPEETPPPVVVSSPKLESPPRPDYPPAARRLRQSARVTVRVLVGKDGRVEEAALSGSEVGLGFDRAALEAARRSRWIPARRNGVPIEAWAQLTIDFQP